MQGQVACDTITRNTASIIKELILVLKVCISKWEKKDHGLVEDCATYFKERRDNFRVNTK